MSTVSICTYIIIMVVLLLLIGYYDPVHNS